MHASSIFSSEKRSVTGFLVQSFLRNPSNACVKFRSKHIHVRKIQKTISRT